MANIMVSIIAAYLVGCFPTAYLVGRLHKGLDIREVGDRNMGAANVYRQVGHWSGLFVCLADIGKGILAIAISRWLGVSDQITLVSGFAVVVGHNWPVFLGFRGGRGEATATGVLLSLLPRETLILIGVASIPLAITRNMIFSSIFLFLPLPLLAWWFGASGMYIAFSMVLPALVGFTHYLTTRNLPADVERGALR
ncbi:MAG: glycerol-3-phosphate acyltransferase [Chloroflexi bacterium]|nr:glycerol-3-phosphate acyltransferase [Chloroflexota bacterium]